MKPLATAAALLTLACCTHVAAADDAVAVAVGAPDRTYGTASPEYYPSLAWTATQLVPSPELAVGAVHVTDVNGVREATHPTAFGLRWQLTPVLWSWGVHRKVNRWRFFVVDPLARNAGSIEADLAVEYLWGHVDRFLLRPGVHATFPLVEHGEYLSTSIGTSAYVYDGVPRVAYDAGLYTLFGLFGVNVTVAPAHLPLATMASLRFRYF